MKVGGFFTVGFIFILLGGKLFHDAKLRSRIHSVWILIPFGIMCVGFGAFLCIIGCFLLAS